MSFIECINNLKSEAEAIDARMAAVELERDAALDAYATMKARHDQLEARLKTIKEAVGLCDNAIIPEPQPQPVAEPIGQPLPATVASALLPGDLKAAIERITGKPIGDDFKPVIEPKPALAGKWDEVGRDNTALLEALDLDGMETFMTVRELHKAAVGYGFSLNEASVRNRMRWLMERFPQKLEQRDSPLAWRIKP